tara:strand:- start:93 stop:602 length:510 start_codon:yes stop_codon:yes gene_type:complete
MTKRQDQCVCGYIGRQDHVFTHRKKCRGAKKIEALHNENMILRQMCKTIPSDVIMTNLRGMEKQKVKQETNENDKQGFLYILRTRESVRLDESVYKIGKTYDMEQRLKNYPKGSELLKSIKVCERHIAEKVLLREFSSKFTNREEFGNEYFEGDLQEMLVIFEEFSKIF